MADITTLGKLVDDCRTSLLISMKLHPTTVLDSYAGKLDGNPTFSHLSLAVLRSE